MPLVHLKRCHLFLAPGLSSGRPCSSDGPPLVCSSSAGLSSAASAAGVTLGGAKGTRLQPTPASRAETTSSRPGPPPALAQSRRSCTPEAPCGDVFLQGILLYVGLVFYCFFWSQHCSEIYFLQYIFFCLSCSPRDPTPYKMR
jgi:hypothetical protein